MDYSIIACEKNEEVSRFGVCYVPVSNSDKLTLTITDVLGNVVRKIENISTKPDGQAPIMIRDHEYFIHTQGLINQEEEQKKITEELTYTKSFLESVMKKLSNERFVSNAKPEVVAIENKKKSDAEAKIKLLESQLEGMGKGN